MNDRFTERVRKVLFLARDEASRLQHEYIGTEHLLLGIVREGEGIAAKVLKKMGLDFEQIRLAVEKLVAATGGTVTIGEIPFTPRAKTVLELSVEEARLLGHNYVGTEHLLLGLIREGEGVAARVLLDLGADRKKVREEILKLLGATGGQRKNPRREKSETPALDQFGRDLTVYAAEGKLDPVIGRDHEIERVIQVLCRRKKNNPVLIGEPGVGKTAIVEGLAQHIVENDVPELLKDKRMLHARPGQRRGGHQVPRPVRGAAQVRDERDSRVHGRDHLHRRAAHDRGRRRRRRRHRRLQHAQARPGPRRDAVHRRHHPGRVPQAHREGWRPGATLPDDPGQSAQRGGDHCDHPRPARQVRGAPPGDLHRRCHRCRPSSSASVHHRPLPARQGRRRHRRGRRPRPPGRDAPSPRSSSRWSARWSGSSRRRRARSRTRSSRRRRACATRRRSSRPASRDLRIEVDENVSEERAVVDVEDIAA